MLFCLVVFLFAKSCDISAQYSAETTDREEKLGLGTKNFMDSYTTYYFLLGEVLAKSIGGVTLPALLLYSPRTCWTRGRKWTIFILLFNFFHSLCSFMSVMFVNFRKLAGKTIFITGASRGIGKAIALKAARDGANIVIAAKTTEPHPKLPGTIYTAAKEGKLIFKFQEISHRL